MGAPGPYSCPLCPLPHGGGFGDHDNVITLSDDEDDDDDDDDAGGCGDW